VLYVPSGATFGVGSKNCAAPVFLLTSAFFINIYKNFSKYGALATSLVWGPERLTEGLFLFSMAGRLE
jgi:hypothetical protein